MRHNDTVQFGTKETNRLRQNDKADTDKNHQHNYDKQFY